jgi:hypothetical protein
VTLASPGRGSGRVIPPSVFPVVPAQRARLGLRKPTGHAPGPGTIDALFRVEPPVDRTLDAQPVPVEKAPEDRPEQAPPSSVPQPGALRPVLAEPPVARPVRVWWRPWRQPR